MYCEKCGSEISRGAKFCEKCGFQVEPVEQEKKEDNPHKKWILGGIIGGMAFVSVVTVGVLFAMGILGGKEEIVQTSAGVMQTDTEISNAAIQTTEQPTEVPTATPTITQNHVTDSVNAMSEIKETVKVIEVNLTEEEYAFGVDKNNKDLLQSANDFIKEIKGDGTLDEICNHYFGEGEPIGVQSAEFDQSKDQLVIATNAVFEPFEYMKGSDYYGIDMEIAAAFAKKLGKELVIQNMDFDAVCLSVGQHKSDMVIAGLTIKKDRKKYVTFSDEYYSASQRLVVGGDNTEFDSCGDKASVEELLKKKDKNVTIGVQNGTTGQFYCEGNKDWGFDGLDVTTTGYKNGFLAVKDMLNGSIDYVLIDSTPARTITDTVNKMQQ